MGQPASLLPVASYSGPGQFENTRQKQRRKGGEGQKTVSASHLLNMQICLFYTVFSSFLPYSHLLMASASQLNYRTKSHFGLLIRKDSYYDSSICMQQWVLSLLRQSMRIITQLCMNDCFVFQIHRQHILGWASPSPSPSPSPCPSQPSYTSTCLPTTHQYTGSHGGHFYQQLHHPLHHQHCSSAALRSTASPGRRVSSPEMRGPLSQRFAAGIIMCRTWTHGISYNMYE